MSIFWAILSKDLRTELRTRQTAISTVVFAVLVLVVFNFSFELRGADLVTLAPGVLWATFIFNAMLVFGRVFASEQENAAIEGLALAPIDRGLIFAAKWAFSTLLMLGTELVVLLVFGVVFNSNAFSPLLLIDIFLATAGFASVGTALAVIAFNSKAREVMLPILLLPLTVPLIIGAVRCTALIFTDTSWHTVVPWFNLMLAFDILVGAVCYYGFGSLLEQ
jgi:heme exporter protein B